MSSVDQYEPDPLAEALQRKVNHQDDRIADLESDVAELQSELVQLKRQLAEVEA